jgi:SH3 domain-containing YSC84-like protein 1
MKTIILGLVVLGFVGQAFALDKAELDQRIKLLAAKFEAMQDKRDKRVPADMLAKAKGIVLLDRFKGGFGFAYQGGSGVALVKDARGNWSPAAFLTAREGSFGFQVGGQENFDVILLMTTNAARALTDATFDLGAEAQGTAGHNSAGVADQINSPKHAVMVYDDRDGLFGGVAFKSGSLSPDNDANRIYYGHFVTMSDILFDQQIKPTEPVIMLAQKVSSYAKK